MASILSAIQAQLVTDIETTSIVKCYIGAASSTTKHPRAELFYGGGEITDFLTNVQDRDMSFVLILTGKSQEVTELASEEIMKLWRNSAKLAVLNALGVVTIYASSENSATLYAGSITQQPIQAEIEINMTVRYTT